MRNFFFGGGRGKLTKCIMLKWWICKPIISLPAQIKYQSSRSLEGSSSLRSLRARLRYSIEKGGNYKRAETARFCQKRFPPSNFLTLFRTLWRRWKGFFQLPPPPPVPSSTSSTFICSFISWATPLLGKFILSEFNDGFYYSIKAAISPIDLFDLLTFILGSEACIKWRKQKKCFIKYWATRLFLLLYSPNPRSQVWILIYRNWPITLFCCCPGHRAQAVQQKRGFSFWGRKRRH